MQKQRPDTFVSAVVHLDEKTPHMHVTFVPPTQDGRLSAKDIIGNRKHLIAWQDAYWQHMVSKFLELQRGESASKTGLKHIPPLVFKQMVRLTKQSQRIEAALDSTNMFNAKSKAEEVKKLLARYIPAVEEMATQLKKYGVAFEEFGQALPDLIIRHNLIIGHNPDGTPITRWINGHTMQELIENGAALLHPEAPQEAPEKPGVPTFRKYATSWLELYKTHTVRHTTYSEYASILQKHLIPAFSDLPVTEITTDRIQQLLNGKRDYASKTLHEIQMVLGMVLEGAVEDRLITRNPAKSKRLRNPSTKKNEREALTEEQVGDIICHLPDLKQKRDQRYLALLIYTGMRREEVLDLCWEDVDTENGLLHVRRAITFKGNLPVIGETKTRNGKRTIPLHPDLQRAGQLMGGMFKARNSPA